MKWINKGHEFDEMAREYHDKFGGRCFYAFGAGIIGARYAETFKYFGLLKGFIDNNCEKQGTNYCEMPVISLEDWEQCHRDNTFLVACVDKKNYEQIRSQLVEHGLEDGKDFIWYEEFYNKVFPVLVAYEQNKVFLPLVQISITERCTLKCKKCAHACNLVTPQTPDLSVEEACLSADALFSFVDYVQEFVLIGGEPFLYKDIDKVIEYIGKKYRSKMDMFTITTNGTLMPKDATLNLCRKYGVIFRISNYAKTLPWIEEKNIKLTKKLAENQIPYIYYSTDIVEWMDYGFEYVDHHGTPKQLIEIFDKCNTPCHEIRGNKFYFCVMARSVSENMNRHVGEDDYLDLGELYQENAKKIVLEYIMGFSDKGYLDMCNYCHGAETRLFPIPPAEQMK